MELITEAVKALLPPLYTCENYKDPLIQVKFFTPWTSWTWYAMEFDGEDTCFGLVDGQFTELGYFSLKELEAIRGPGGLTVERDLYFTPRPLSEVQALCRGIA